MRNKSLELKFKKKKIKKQLRRKRRELLDLEEELKCVAREQKTEKQIAQNRRHKEVLIAKARKGNLRLTKRTVMKILGEEAA